MTDAEIYDRLAGEYSRRCVEPCGRCKTSGVHQLLYDRDCPHCSGTGFVYREDGHPLMLDAIGWWYVSGHRDRWNSELVAVRESLPVGSDRGYCVYPWIHRHSQPWCESLESFVRDHQADPPDLMANDGRELKRLLRECGKIATFQTSWQMASVEYDQDWCAIVGMTGRYGKTEAAALRAAVEAMLGDIE